jgi:hypothetical protein
MNLVKDLNMYNRYDYEHEYPLEMNNKLYCTFTLQENIDELIFNLKTKYTIIYNKMFILSIENSDEFIITYNIELGNISSIPENTILVHRKKEFNVLYTINALNELIKSLNGGKYNNSYPIEWKDYKNSILLTQQGSLKQLNTKLNKIIDLNIC